MVRGRESALPPPPSLGPTPTPPHCNPTPSHVVVLVPRNRRPCLDAGAARQKAAVAVQLRRPRGDRRQKPIDE